MEVGPLSGQELNRLQLLVEDDDLSNDAPVEIPKPLCLKDQVLAPGRRFKAWVKSLPENPLTYERASNFTMLLSFLLGIATTTTAVFVATKKGKIFGFQLTDLHLAKLGAYSITAVLASAQLRQQATLVREKQESLDHANPIDKQHIKLLKQVAYFATFAAAMLVAFAAFEKLIPGTHGEGHSLNELIDLLVPATALLAMSANSAHLVRRKIEQERIKKTVDLDAALEAAREARPPLSDRMKRVFDTCKATAGITAVLLGAATIAMRYGFKIESVRCPGFNMQFDLTKSLSLCLIGGVVTGLAAFKARGHQSSQEAREEKALLCELVRGKTAEDIDEQTWKTLTRARNRRAMRHALGGLLIAAALVGMGLQIWSFNGMKGKVGFSLDTDIFSVASVTLSTLGIAQTGFGMWKNADHAYFGRWITALKEQEEGPPPSDDESFPID